MLLPRPRSARRRIATSTDRRNLNETPDHRSPSGRGGDLDSGRPRHPEPGDSRRPFRRSARCRPIWPSTQGSPPRRPAPRGEIRRTPSDQLPEFLMGLRAAGVTNLGVWMNLHPAGLGEVRDGPDRTTAPTRDRHAAGHVPPGCDVWLAQPSRLPDLDSPLGPGHPLRHRLLIADVQRGAVVLRDRRQARLSSRTRARPIRRS